MIAPDPRFRPNPERAIYVHGTLNSELVHKLTPRILELQHQSREPITVYIDSNGGEVPALYSMLRLLRSGTQDDVSRCEIVTVVTGRAASAAADLLAAGDYALAYPGSEILFHGGRIPEPFLTAERSSALAQFLRKSNEFSAIELSEQIEFRFMFRYISAHRGFDSVREKQDSPEMSDLKCFLVTLREQLTESAKKIFDRTSQRYDRYNELRDSVHSKTGGDPKSKDLADLGMEAAKIKAILDFEVDRNSDDPKWSFQTVGIHDLTNDFLLLVEIESMAEDPRFRAWCKKFGIFLLTPKEEDDLEKIEEEEGKTAQIVEIASPRLVPVWSFFVALCYTLQQDDDDFLTAKDAYYLGLIDEVFGDIELPTLRMLNEYKSDAEDSASTENDMPEGKSESAAPSSTS